MPVSTLSLNDAQIDAIYRILVVECQVNPDPEWITSFEDFKRILDQQQLPIEWKFMGNLGSGGKFYFNGLRAYVDCYTEDLDAPREAVINRANKEIALALARYDGSRVPPEIGEELGAYLTPDGQKAWWRWYRYLDPHAQVQHARVQARLFRRRTFEGGHG
jgi:hypothetical protein